MRSADALNAPSLKTLDPRSEDMNDLRETTGGEFRVYKASIRYIDLL